MMRKRTFHKNIAVSIVLVLVLLFCTQAIRATTISEGSTEDVAKQSTETTEAEPTQDPNPPPETTDSQSDGEDKADDTSDSTESTTVVTETDPTLAESAETEESTEVKSDSQGATEAADDTTTTTETIQKQPVLMMRSARMTVSANHGMPRLIAMDSVCGLHRIRNIVLSGAMIKGLGFRYWVMLKARRLMQAIIVGTE